MNIISNAVTIFESISKAGAISPTTLNGLPGMSSLEIAEITSKRHDHVLRDIRKMLTELGTDAPDLGTEVKYAETVYQTSRGRLEPLTVLNKELTFTLLSRYSFKLSNMIVKRWLELEGSGFERVSIAASVVHLAEREKDIRSVALMGINRSRTKRSLSLAEKEQLKWVREAKRYADSNPMR
ncbi:Rha family transcriptional regulator [Pseudomonas siliginis]|uniref:Rha family transcriptional regulator n=1 Tax=Pseudomonas siliginis TaxID=2842346 RepID=UPI00209310A8|nr:Rha family transcriptional regulator [Pseudomonas siliginis]UST75153.1 Rha family transcriptional regulator [Pseudomonas siliginis]UST90985.1 Rha family transcriptional regulator [Pseudomonas siliginis]